MGTRQRDANAAGCVEIWGISVHQGEDLFGQIIHALADLGDVQGHTGHRRDSPVPIVGNDIAPTVNLRELQGGCSVHVVFLGLDFMPFRVRYLVAYRALVQASSTNPSESLAVILASSGLYLYRPPTSL